MHADFYLDGLVISARDKERLVTACKIVQAIDSFFVAFQGEVRLRRRETPHLCSIIACVIIRSCCGRVACKIEKRYGTMGGESDADVCLCTDGCLCAYLDGAVERCRGEGIRILGIEHNLLVG
jgi:hypothetical protein